VPAEAPAWRQRSSRPCGGGATAGRAWLRGRVHPRASAEQSGSVRKSVGKYVRSAEEECSLGGANANGARQSKRAAKLVQGSKRDCQKSMAGLSLEHLQSKAGVRNSIGRLSKSGREKCTRREEKGMVPAKVPKIWAGLEETARRAWPGSSSSIYRTKEV
jgi:hypothetical protein